MSKHKRGKIIRGEERQIVYNVIKYFDGEKDAKECQPYEQSEARASMATGLPVNTVSQIKTKGPREQQSSSETNTNSNTERKRRRVLNHSELCVIREIIERIYDNMEVPTVRKILVNARKELNTEFSRARVRSILRNKLGFKFNKRYSNNNVALERNSIRAWRVKYLRFIRENDALGQEKRPVVYVGELVIIDPATKQKWMVIHAGSENGFIRGAKIICNYTNYKKKPRGKEFLEYVKANLVPKLPKECIVVMNNSARHNLQLDKIPTMWSTKEDIKKWMVDHYIPFEEDWFKAQMLMSIKKTHPIKKYAVDEILAEHGHKVQRIPAFHENLNPIEYIWMKVKSRVAEENKKGGKDSTENLIRMAIESITVDDWKEQVDLVKKIEERYWLREVIKEEEYDDLLCATGLMSDTDSDSDTEGEIRWSSSSSEDSDDDSGDDWMDIE